MLSCRWFAPPISVLADCAARIASPRPGNGSCAGACSPPSVSRSIADGSTARPIPSRSLPASTTFASRSASTRPICTAAVLAALHEGGHGLYDQGFDPDDRHTLLSEAPSMGLQESQARLWENHVGRSRAFWDYVFPSLPKLFPDAMKGLDAESFYRDVNVVRPGLIRVAADEISYHLHIVLRYELEVALISGALGIRDLPAVWNERSASLIGARPASDREGVLQDVHWSLGMFGYFPTYTLGSLYAAQLAETYARAHPLEDEIRRGEFSGLLSWLRTNIHRLGQRSSAEEIIEKATGKGLDASAFFRHLERKGLAHKPQEAALSGA